MGKFRLLLLRVLLITICLYHLVLGIVPFLPEKMAIKTALNLFGMDIVVSAQLNYMTKLFGIYAGMFGIFMGLAAANPLRYKMFIQWGALLFIMRFLTNILLVNYIREAFNASPFRIWQCIITIAFIGISLCILMPKGKIGR